MRSQIKEIKNSKPQIIQMLGSGSQVSILPPPVIVTGSEGTALETGGRDMS